MTACIGLGQLRLQLRQILSASIGVGDAVI